MSKLQEKRGLFYEQLQNVMDKTPPNHTLILMGDFNAQIGNEIMVGVSMNKHVMTTEIL